jgi:hypothetical protein
VVIQDANVVVAHTLFIRSSVSAVFASAKWHTEANYQALQSLLGNKDKASKIIK